MRKILSATEWKWEGSRYKPQHIHCLFLKQIEPTPWPIKILGVTDFNRDVCFVRKDVGLHLWWILATVWYRCFYDIRWNPNSLVNIVCAKALAVWWKTILKYKYHGDYAAYSSKLAERQWKSDAKRKIH